MNKTVLITGASSGIGLELARIFAEKKYDLVLVARNVAKLRELAQELENVSVTVIGKDLSQLNAAQDIYDLLKFQNKTIDVLVNNAGFGDWTFFHEANWDKQAMMIDVNVRALTQFCFLFGKEMVQRHSGKILNMASTAGFQPGPLMSVYYATKAYVLLFSEGIANEWKSFGVTVTALCPGPTASGFQAGAALEESKLVKGKKLPSAREVAQFGYDSLMKGKTVAVHGFMNRMLALAPRLMPRNFVTQTVRNMQERHSG